MLSSRGPIAVSLILLPTLALACFGLAQGCGETESSPNPDRLYSVVDGTLVDAEGHALFLRGVNVRGDAKYVEDHILPLSVTQLDKLSWSFDSVRLLTHWEAVLPNDGQVDEEYLSALVTEVSKLTGRGFYVIVDMHQDLWGAPFGDGGAEWTCPEEIRAGYVAQSPWWLNYNSEQVRGCFDHFWASEELRGKWREAWTTIAAAVCTHEQVIGFDLFNEPYPGSSLGDPGFDDRVLYPFYQEAIEAIDAVCPERIYFLEPSLSFTFGIGDPMVIQAVDLPRVVVAPHFYPPEVHEPGQTYAMDLTELRERFETAQGGYLDGSSPRWLGEYGGITTNPGIERYLEHITSLFFEGFIGSAVWSFGSDDGDFAWLDAAGTVKPAFERAWSVPFPVRLPARPSRMEPDFDARSLTLSFHCERDRELEVLLPAAGTWSTDFSPAGALELTGQLDNRLTLRCTRKEAVEVVVSP